MTDDEKNNRVQRHAAAFLDLESPICDLKNMSMLLDTVITNDIGLGEREASGYIKLLLSKDQLDSLHFAVLHMDDMIRDLHKVYYAGFAEDGSDIVKLADARNE